MYQRERSPRSHCQGLFVQLSDVRPLWSWRPAGHIQSAAGKSPTALPQPTRSVRCMVLCPITGQETAAISIICIVRRGLVVVFCVSYLCLVVSVGEFGRPVSRRGPVSRYSSGANGAGLGRLIDAVRAETAWQCCELRGEDRRRRDRLSKPLPSALDRSTMLGRCIETVHAGA